MKLFSTIYICYLVFLSHLTLVSQTPIQKWEFVKSSTTVDKEFLHGYNVGVSSEGFTFVSCDHNEQYPLMVAMLPNGSELFSFEHEKSVSLDYFYKIRIEASNIYKNNAFDEKKLFGLQCTWMDSTTTKFSPAELYYSRIFLKKVTNGNGEFENNNLNFHSTSPSGYHELIKFVSHATFVEVNDSIEFRFGVYEMRSSGSIARTIDSFTIGKIKKDEFVSLPKPQAMRWFNGSKQLGVMITPDTLIPSEQTFTQVYSSKIVDNYLEKIENFINLNPYLIQNFEGKRLKWKGFTNSSFGFVALFENLDDENKNILIRYNNHIQEFRIETLYKTIDCKSLYLDSIGRLVLVGVINTEENSDFYLGYYNQNGELQEKVWGGSEFERLNDVVIDSFGEIAVSGQKGNDLYLAKFTFNATSVSDKGTNSLTSLFVNQGTSVGNTSEVVVKNLESGKTTIKLYSLQGTIVSTIFEGTTFGNGTYRFPILSDNLTSGMYLIIVQNNHNVITKKFIHTP